MLPRLPDYARTLRAATADYRGKRERAVRCAADVFEFYEALFSDRRLARAHREIVSAVIAYFVVRDDYLPEETLGAVGLVDDLYVAAFGFRCLQRDVAREVLLDAWKGEGDLVEVMAEVYSECRAELGRSAKDVLRMAGLA